MEKTNTNRAAGAPPVVAVTLGDVAGIGPEIVVRAWSDPRLHQQCRPVVIGSAAVLRREIERGKHQLRIQPITAPSAGDPSPSVIPCLEASELAVADLPVGRVHAAAGRAAFDYLTTAIDLAVSRSVDAIVTMPLNKEGLKSAGLPYPGHTEILAERTGTPSFGMMLYRRGLGVVHVTLHVALREVFAGLSTPAVFEKIELLETMMRRLGVDRPRLAIAALNPHASDGGVFGDEEATIIAPAVEQARKRGWNVSGPLPTDTLFVRANDGEFDGVVAMYHDQGHIALKLLGWREAVNITVGLPIVRTSVAHGTAYDIVGQGRGDPTSFFEALAVAVKLANTRINDNESE